MNKHSHVAFFIAALLVPYGECLPQVSNIERGLLNVHVTPSINQPGKVVNAIKWSDIQGNNLLLLSESIHSVKRGTTHRSANLFASHYLEVDGKWVRQWKVEDHENDCPVDVGATFIPNSIEITDLNTNGYAEVSFMYRMFCTGGLDPQTLKLIMYEKKKKYAIRGETLVRLPQQPAYGGETRFDISMKTAPPEFQKFAEKQWNRFRMYP